MLCPCMRASVLVIRLNDLLRERMREKQNNRRKMISLIIFDSYELWKSGKTIESKDNIGEQDEQIEKWKWGTRKQMKRRECGKRKTRHRNENVSNDEKNGRKRKRKGELNIKKKHG